ncbi:hypothetical protein ACF3NA_00780 [Alkanindiges sp. WGS2144]|uniref:hypothetical protein n=1 Tax=Alkanindiges sp. WGS2144 TaxID=3366808 RepID=UPI0037507CA0
MAAMVVTSRPKKSGIFFKTDAAVLALIEQRFLDYENRISLHTGSFASKARLDFHSFKIQGYLDALKDVGEISYLEYHEFFGRLNRLDIQVRELVAE